MIIECPSCQAFVEADEVGGYKFHRGGNGPQGRFLFLRCCRCASPILVTQDNVGNIAEGDIWSTPTRIFPGSEFRSNPKAPSSIRAAFEEAIACYQARAYTAAAVMCRKTLEGICHG